jgi:hypothetical protein
MTYDELLDKLTDKVVAKAKIVNNEIVWNKSPKSAFALHSIVKIHAPQEITLPDGSYSYNCQECDGWVYPCQTIEAIKKDVKP